MNVHPAWPTMIINESAFGPIMSNDVTNRKCPMVSCVPIKPRPTNRAIILDMLIQLIAESFMFASKV